MIVLFVSWFKNVIIIKINCKEGINRMYAIKKSLVIMLSSLFFFCSFIVPSFANDEIPTDFTTNNYKVRINVNRDNTADYEQSISVKFTAESDQFIIDFPDELQDRVEKVSVAGYSYVYDNDTNELIINYNKVSEGNKKTFTINYTVVGVNYFGERPDVLELPLLSNEWPTEVDKFTANIYLFDKSSWGNQDQRIGNNHELTNEYGTWTVDSKNQVISVEAANIPAETESSIKFDLPPGFWANAKSIDNIRIFIIATMLIGMLIFFGARVRYGRSLNPLIARIMYAPSDLNPSMAGYLYDDYVDETNIWASIIYLAHSGYIRIVEYDRCKFEFELLKYPKDEKSSSKAVFKLIFEKDYSIGRVVSLEDCGESLKHNLSKYKKAVIKDIMGSNVILISASERANRLVRCTFFINIWLLTTLNYAFHYKSELFLSSGFVVSFIVATIMSSALSWFSSTYNKNRVRPNRHNKNLTILAGLVYLVISAAYIYMDRFAFYGRSGDAVIATVTTIYLIFAPLVLFGMRSLSPKNAELSSKILGLKEFVETASKAEVEAQAKKDTDYFFKLFPYAFIFDMTKKLASLFENVDMDIPTWYYPYHAEEGYSCDILLINSMTNNLMKGLRETVLKKDKVKSMVTK